MTTSATSLVSVIKSGRSLSCLLPAALADYGLDSNPHFNHPDLESRKKLFSYYTDIVNKGVTAEDLHRHLKEKTLHELLGKYFEEEELKSVLIDGRVKNVYETITCIP